MSPIVKNITQTYKTSQGDIEIYVPKGAKLLVKISGGADSAIVSYMLAKYRHEVDNTISFIFATSVAEPKAYQALFASQIIKWINQVYPLGEYEHRTNNNLGGDDYEVGQERLTNPIMLQVDQMWTGITCNPPMEVMEQEKRENAIVSERNVQVEHAITQDKPLSGPHGGFLFNGPLMNTDKKGVAELYDILGVRDTLFPLTRSCEHHTKNFTHHCGECWFCWEREWGFGKLDDWTSKRRSFEK